MRKMIYTALAVLLFFGCGHKGNETAKMNGIEFDSVVVDSTCSLTEAKAAPTCKISLSIQYAKGNNAQKINDTLLRCGILTPDYLSLPSRNIAMKEAVDSFVNKYISDYKRDYGQLYREDHEHGASYNCIYKVKTHTEDGGDDILNYIASISTYGGGAHGIDQTLVKNFNIKTGHLITLSDIFINGYEQELKDIIIKKMAKKFNVKDLEGLKKKFIFADNNVYISENFILKEDSITFIYCEDEIAPHALGEIRIDIDKSEIEKLCK
ncbi:MAG: RsiV family protein [Prevotella sp.]|jgi:hypothetical protein|nr:RsiV family protein [Prevotella sp.]MCI1281462.1 RsiV family protein [Prevotella sp.]